MLASALLVCSFTSSASILCDFTNENGVGFEFAQNSSYDKYTGNPKTKIPDIDNKWLHDEHDLSASLLKKELRYPQSQSEFQSVYKDWFYDARGEKNIEFNKFFSRRAKLEQEPFLRHKETSSDAPYDKIWVRYYRAKADNCESVYLRVEETDSRVAKYLNIEDDRIDGDINFEWEESEFNVRFVDNFHKLDTWVGKKIYIKPGADRTKWIDARESFTHKAKKLKNHETLTVTGLFRGAFELNGKFLSPYMIEVKAEDGSSNLIPWIPEKISFSDPFSDKNIREKYKPAIRRGVITFGMNQNEVELSWGSPSLERDYDIGTNSMGSETIRDETYRQDGKLKNFRVYPADVKKTGKMVAWHYPSILPKKHFLVFDREGILLEENQTYALGSPEIQRVYNAEQ